MIIPYGYSERIELPQTHRCLESLWTSHANEDGNTTILPDGRCDLIVKFDINTNGLIQNITPVITGPSCTPYPISYAKGNTWIGIRLRPTFAGLIWRDNLPDAKNRILRGHEQVTNVISAFSLIPNELSDLNSLRKKMEAVLLELPYVPSSSNIESVVQQIHLTGGQISIANIAVSYGSSTRHLNRLFSQEVGLSPKLYSSIVQFHRALRFIRQRQLTLSEIAFETGYSDQAHMSRSFRKFGGFTPLTLPDNINLPGFSENL